MILIFIDCSYYVDAHKTENKVYFVICLENILERRLIN